MSVCPRCGKPLETMQVDTLNARMCRACTGMLLTHADLVNVIEASWRAVTEETADATPLRAPDGWLNEPTFNCPDCAQPMEKYGYMGIAAIQVDRCDVCGLVWLDADELQNMVLALAKENYRSEHERVEIETRQVDVWPVAVANAAPKQGNWLFVGSKHDGGPVAVLAQVLLRLLLR